MSWKCPKCGRRNYETFKNCVCGHYVDESLILKYRLTDGHDASLAGEQFFEMPFDDADYQISSSQGTSESRDVKVLESPESKSDMSVEEVIKEIDSWMFTFSDAENCICIGTPALQSFRLKLTRKDLEDLLEFLYQKTGEEKTMRKCRLSPEEIADVIDKADRMIEEKRSKVALKLTDDELQELADLLNVKLKV
jgi:hypothetical protein